MDSEIWVEGDCAFSATYRVVKNHFDRQRKKMITTVLVIITPEEIPLKQLLKSLETLGHGKTLKYQGKIYLNIETVAFKDGINFLQDFCELLEFYSQNVITAG